MKINKRKKAADFSDLFLSVIPLEFGLYDLSSG
jgi:hypothetical protein